MKISSSTISSPPSWDGEVLEVDWLIVLDGSGYYLRRKPPGRVRITALGPSPSHPVEFIAQVDEASLDQAAEGLVYTDEGFMRGLRANLVKLGMEWENAQGIGYSEQGMQPLGGISFDVGPPFLAAWKALPSAMQHRQLSSTCPAPARRRPRRL